MKKLWLISLGLLVLIVVFGLVFYFSFLKNRSSEIKPALPQVSKTAEPSAEPRRISLVVRSEVPGVNLKLKNEAELQKFLNQIGFLDNQKWRLDVGNQEVQTFYDSPIDTLELVFSNQPQPEWRAVDLENRTLPLSSVGKVVRDRKILITFQVNLSRWDSPEKVNLVINDLFLKVLSGLLSRQLKTDKSDFLELEKINP